MTKHKHYELIKLWANGAHIQYLQDSTGAWIDCIGNQPGWYPSTQYRVKPAYIQIESVTVKGKRIDEQGNSTYWEYSEPVNKHFNIGDAFNFNLKFTL